MIWVIFSQAPIPFNPKTWQTLTLWPRLTRTMFLYCLHQGETQGSPISMCNIQPLDKTTFPGVLLQVHRITVCAHRLVRTMFQVSV